MLIFDVHIVHQALRCMFHIIDFRLRKFSRSVSGDDLVGWLLSHELAATKDQACIIGQALIDAELIENIDIKVSQAINDFTPIQFSFKSSTCI